MNGPLLYFSAKYVQTNKRIEIPAMSLTVFTTFTRVNRIEQRENEIHFDFEAELCG